MLFKLPFILLLSGLAAASTLSRSSKNTFEQDQNICRTTANYGCTLSGINCYDHITQAENVIFHGTKWSSSSKSWECPPDYLMSDEENLGRAVCCKEANLNGGYCPPSQEILSVGFKRNHRSGVGRKPTKKIVGINALHAMNDGKASLKCNKRGGPHYCFNEGEHGCEDEGMYD